MHLTHKRSQIKSHVNFYLQSKHFFHTSCFAFWFDHKRENFPHLTCHNYTQFSTVSNEYVEQKVTFYLREAIPLVRNLYEELLEALLEKPTSSNDGKYL